MTDNLPAAPKKSFLSRMFGKKNKGQADDFDHALTLQQARDRIENGEAEKQDLEKYTASLRARYGHKFRSSRFIHPDDGDEGVSSYLYAFVSPVSNTWKINRYDHMPQNGVRTQEIKSGLCFWDALKTVAEYECAQRSMGKVEAEGELLRDEVQAPHYKDFATAECIPLDLDGLPLVVYEGEIIGDAMYDEQAVELARMPKPPVPVAEDETVQLTAQLAFTKAEMNTDDLKRIIDKESARSIFEEVGKECGKLEKWMEDFLENAKIRKPLTKDAEYLIEITLRTVQNKISPLDENEELQNISKNYLDPMVEQMKIEIVTALAKDSFEALLGGRKNMVLNTKERRDILEDRLSRLEAIIEVHAHNGPELEEEIRLYIMDRDRDIVMPPSIKKLREFCDAVSNALSKNIEIDNRTSVHTGYNSYLSNKFNTYTDMNYKGYQNNNTLSCNENNKGKKPDSNGGGKMDIIR